MLDYISAMLNPFAGSGLPPTKTPHVNGDLAVVMLVIYTNL